MYPENYHNWNHTMTIVQSIFILHDIYTLHNKPAIHSIFIANPIHHPFTGGFNLSLWKIWVRQLGSFPYIWKVIKFMSQTTYQKESIYHPIRSYDGRDPAPVDRWFIHLSHYLQAFNHPFGDAGFRHHPQYSHYPNNI